MNELRENYEPENYFLNKTRSVYLNLDGCILRLQTTSSRVPKRAVCGESLSNVTFNDQRIYDLTDSICVILPQDLCRKRYWSKKYPLCLTNVKLVSKKRNLNNTTNNSSQDVAGSSTPKDNKIINFDESSKNKSTLLDTNTTLILFARTDREKEEWFQLFKKASAKKLLDSSNYIKQNRYVKQDSSTKLESNNNSSKEISLNSTMKLVYCANSDKIIYKIQQTKSADKPNGDDEIEPNETAGKNAPSSHEVQTESGFLYDASLNFMNTFLIRIFADFFTHKQWISLIQNKIQNKLSKIKLPYFIEGLKVVDLDLGSVIPIIRQSSEPWCDKLKGLWVHLDIDYSGGLQITLSTKLNLMKLKSTPNNIELSDLSRKKEDSVKKDRSAIYNSDEEDSPESSGDEYVHTDFFNDEESKLIEQANPTKKILNLVNKIAASNYFQKATENKYIKMAMENVSNCQLVLNIEVKKITGTLALNIPPHPSDRLWYGFVSPPVLTLVPTPQVGEKEVSYTAISDFIADKLKSEFQVNL
jgi:hypothetical protein